MPRWDLRIIGDRCEADRREVIQAEVRFILDTDLLIYLNRRDDDECGSRQITRCLDLEQGREVAMMKLVQARERVDDGGWHLMAKGTAWHTRKPQGQMVRVDSGAKVACVQGLLMGRCLDS